MSEVNGIILVNKEKGITSRDVVNELNKIFNTKKIGHAGTLDPIASGLLIIGINKGLKLLKFLNNLDKTYISEVELGYLTDTLDKDGEVLKKEKNYLLKKSHLEDTLKSFLGDYLQEVPIYSATKVNGKRLYQYARENKKIDLPIKKREVKSIKLLDIDKDSFIFKTEVSSGTYIRKLIEDISKKENILMTMSNLKRTKVGNFSLENAYTINDIKKGNYKILNIEEVLDIKVVNMNDDLYFKVKNGQKLKEDFIDDLILFKYKDKDIAIYKKENEIYKAVNVFV